jgi:predicted glycogen debranching enzyme
MLPNRFVEGDEPPEYNSVDASLWFVISAHELMAIPGAVDAGEKRRLDEAIAAIVAGYAGGTRHGIHADVDGLLIAGEPGVQLTWMDAKVGDWVVTPRIGKPVEVNALWVNALAIAKHPSLAQARTEFENKFWNPERRMLYDVVDPDDAAFRPNQIFAVGGLPLALLEGERARAVVDAVEAVLWTPMGLRSLAPGEHGYRDWYGGSPLERDGAYHQGPVWTWLAGPFIEAWVRVRGNSPAAREHAREHFLAPLLAHRHLAELAQPDPPFDPTGAPFQAWSLGETIRLDALLR